MRSQKSEKTPSMRRRRAIPFQPQLDAADCGAAALAMALRHHGLRAALEDVRDQVRPVR
ncbi:MAG TPA: cysteine peptidase family C39 domain-containing protein, partial [Chloroflexota bacterium]